MTTMTVTTGRRSSGVANVVDSDIRVSKFEHQSFYYFYNLINNFGKKYEYFNLPSSGLNDTITGLQQG